MLTLFSLFLSVFVSVLTISPTLSINTASIRSATEAHMRKAVNLVEDNYVNKIASGEFYGTCTVYDACYNPPVLNSGGNIDESDTIPSWETSGSPWHNSSYGGNSVHTR